jgi:hypothetical protein
MSYIRVANSNNTITVPQYWQKIDLSSGSVIYYNGGNVGVGIPNPKASLHLVNNCGIGAAYSTSSVPTDSLIVSGNVGIGTNYPVAKLDVRGVFYAPGSIVNVWHASTSTANNVTTTGAWTETNLSITITPKFATSSLLIQVETMIGTYTDNYIYAAHRLLRDNVALITNDGVANIEVGTPLGISFRDTIRYLAPANSTTSTTFKTQFQRSAFAGNYGYVTVHRAPSRNVISPGTITIMEICN